MQLNRPLKQKNVIDPKSNPAVNVDKLDALCLFPSSLICLFFYFQLVCWPLTPEWGRGRSRARREPERNSPGRNAEEENRLTPTQIFDTFRLTSGVNVAPIWTDSSSVSPEATSVPLRVFQNKELNVFVHPRKSRHVSGRGSDSSSCSEPLQPADGSVCQGMKKSWIYLSVY